MARLCHKYPTLCDTVSVTHDTTYKIDTFARVDTTILTSPIDTILIETEKVRTRIIRRNDTIMVDQVVKPDTIIKIKTREVIRVKVQDYPKWAIPSGLLILLLLGVSLYKNVIR